LFLPQWSGRNEGGDGDEEKSLKKILKKEAKERDRESESGHGHGHGFGNGNGMLPKGWKEEDVEETIGESVFIFVVSSSSSFLSSFSSSRKSRPRPRSTT